MTVKVIEQEARRILQDSVQPYRWSSSEIRDAVQEGVCALNAIRPETRYIDGSLVDYVVIPESDTADIAINRRYREALVFYAVYKCYLNDATDTVNAQLAEMYLGKFNTKSQL